MICQSGSNFHGGFVPVHFCVPEIWVYPKRISLAPNWLQLSLLIFGSLMWCYFISHLFFVPMYPVQGLFSAWNVSQLGLGERQHSPNFILSHFKMWSADCGLLFFTFHFPETICHSSTLKCYQTKL